MRQKKVDLSQKIYGALFDMDGVILDSMPYHVKAWKDAFKDKGLKVDEKFFYLYEGAIEPEVACRLFGQNGADLSLNDFFQIHQLQKRYFLERYSSRVKPFDGAAELIEWLKTNGTKTALVTSSHEEILEAVLPEHLKTLFDYIVTGNSIKRRKPHPDPYLAGIKGIGAIPRNGSVAIENAPAGIESAKRAGLHCIAITTTLNRRYLKDADRIVDDHKELIEMFRPS